jgi:hypothetical protein
LTPAPGPKSSKAPSGSRGNGVASHVNFLFLFCPVRGPNSAGFGPQSWPQGLVLPKNDACYDASPTKRHFSNPLRHNDILPIDDAYDAMTLTFESYGHICHRALSAGHPMTLPFFFRESPNRRRSVIASSDSSYACGSRR